MTLTGRILKLERRGDGGEPCAVCRLEIVMLAAGHLEPPQPLCRKPSGCPYVRRLVIHEPPAGGLPRDSQLFSHR